MVVLRSGPARKPETSRSPEAWAWRVGGSIVLLWDEFGCSMQGYQDTITHSRYKGFCFLWRWTVEESWAQK